MSIVGILLAAGRGTRFGSDKLLRPLRNGTPMALASARTLRSVCTDCVAVLRPDQTLLATLLQAEGFRTELNGATLAGMGSSLAAAVDMSRGAEGWLVALADMPWIRPQTIRAVLAALEAGAELAAPYFQGRRGHPVGFSEAWRESLSALSGDEGARDLLAVHGAALVPVLSRDPGILMDVDRPEHLLRIDGLSHQKGERDP